MRTSMQYYMGGEAAWWGRGMGAGWPTMGAEADETMQSGPLPPPREQRWRPHSHSLMHIAHAPSESGEGGVCACGWVSPGGH